LAGAHETGVPLFRPLVLNYQDDPTTYNLDDEFMVGDDLLVAPVLKPDVIRRLVYLPKGTWYDYWTNKKYAGETTISVEAPLETVPMFVRGGAIIPTGPELNYVGEKPTTPIIFNIYPDDRGAAATVLYEDDGISPAYKQQGFRRTNVTVERTGGGFAVSVAAPLGQYNPGPRQLAFTIKSERRTSAPVTVTDDGTARKLMLPGQVR
jgi:alpha-glucosidase